LNLSFEEKLNQLLEGDQIYLQEPMSRHTTFRVGGPADYYVTPQCEQVSPLISLCQQCQMPIQVIGNGSNLLVGDKGIRGLVMELGSAAAKIDCQGNELTATAGVLLGKLSQVAADAGLSGLEFAAGIPGTVGGAVVMNAGAYGGEIKDCLINATVCQNDGTILVYPAAELDLSYRNSRIATEKGVVLQAVFGLRKEAETKIRNVMEDLRQQRFAKQPLNFPSAGSTFKRPAGHFAGKLIMEAGLRGFRIGGAAVSEKHCGFVINDKAATAADILELITAIIKRVKEHSGITLEPEVKILGDF
jgi:UDP-N-acetylmuramate dehydrogenase